MDTSANSKVIFIRKLVFRCLGFLDLILNRKNPLFILCYHSVSNDNWSFGISMDVLSLQMAYLVKNYRNVSLKEVEDHIKGIRKIVEPSFVVTFDDGYADIVKASSMFKKLNIKPTVFILADAKNVNREELDTDRKLLDKSGMKTLSKFGWDIQSHGMTHAYLPKVSDPSLEVRDSKLKIYKTYGIQTEYFAYPKGGYSKKIMDIVKTSDYKMALSMDDGAIDRSTNIFAVPRIGVDRSHSFSEFKVLFSPSVCMFRGMLKNLKLI